VELEKVDPEGTCGCSRLPALVATIRVSLRSRRSRPINCSEWPSPYTSAVSMKLTPRSTALWSAWSDVASSALPHASPPIAQAPKPMGEILHPVRPSSRYCILPPVATPYTLHPTPYTLYPSLYASFANSYAIARAMSLASPMSTTCRATSPASQFASIRRDRSCRAGIEQNARVSSTKPAVL